MSRKCQTINNRMNQLWCLVKATNPKQLIVFKSCRNASSKVLSDIFSFLY